MTTEAGSQRLPAYLVRGGDHALVADAVSDLVAGLVGEGDASLVVHELSGDRYDVNEVVDAAQTPPLFGDRRVVVARDATRFLTAEVAPLLAYLADPLDTTSLVLAGGGGGAAGGSGGGGGGQFPRSLVDAVRKVGHLVDATVPARRDRRTWLSARLKEAPVRLDARAAAMVEEHLGDDLGRLGPLCEVLATAYGSGARVGVDELSPFLGRAGSVAPWDLTDAIDRGDAAGALAVLHRLLGAGGRHPLVITSTLHTHFARMLRLDGAGVVDEAQAASALGITGSTFPAKKALAQVRKLGSAGVGRAIHLLAAADLDLKGAVDWPAELVREVLIARLCRRAPPARR